MGMQIKTKTFRSGNSEAVRLPREVAYGRNIEVTVQRDGDVVTIRPVIDEAERRRRWDAMIADMEAVGAPNDGVQAREPFHFPVRPGLYGVDEHLFPDE